MNFIIIAPKKVYEVPWQGKARRIITL